MGLSCLQKEIIDIKGNLIVRASAGTGKTYTLVSKIEKEIKENYTHKSIAAITFTIKAANEIRERMSIDLSEHFIGTNNSFVIEEIIKPFMKDAYGLCFDRDMSTDYSIKIKTYEEGIEQIKRQGIISSYENAKENFVFDLAQNIVKMSKACKLYLKSKYFKIYIDEYQDCDKSMNDLFMYFCDKLHIDIFIVGDEKQSIYTWRGACPKGFTEVWNKKEFKKKRLLDNFRSVIQIQNYSNLLFEETSSLYNKINDLNNIILLQTVEDKWETTVISKLDLNKGFALLRFTNKNAKFGAEILSRAGLECVYIPPLPIANVTTEVGWLYMAIAKYSLLEKFSVYDFIADIPSEGEENNHVISTMKGYLNNIKKSCANKGCFYKNVSKLVQYFGYQTKNKDLDKLYQTITDASFHVAFESEKYKNVAMTLHSSKGLEFEQVVIFAEDYDLSDKTKLYNHYVAVTRAKSKLIIVYTDNVFSRLYIKTVSELLEKNKLSLGDVMLIE